MSGNKGIYFFDQRNKMAVGMIIFYFQLQRGRLNTLQVVVFGF